MLNLYGLDRQKLEDLFIEQGLQAFRGRQLMKWVYHQGKTDFAAMTDLPKTMRQWLQDNACFDLPDVQAFKKSRDGTLKWVLDVGNGNLIETVLDEELSAALLGDKSPAEALADAQSRIFDDSTEWQLLPQYFNTILAAYPDLSIDLFASRLNAQCSCYVSWQLDPHAHAVDAFSLFWGIVFFMLLRHSPLFLGSCSMLPGMMRLVLLWYLTGPPSPGSPSVYPLPLHPATSKVLISSTDAWWCGAVMTGWPT